MIAEAHVRPRGPYSLALSARLSGDATRTFRGRTMRCVLAGEGGPVRGAVWQQPEGTVVLSADSEEALQRLRFCLALDDDHSEFLRRFAQDPLLGRATRVLRGYRPVRLASVAHALLRAVCGQLVTAREARAVERRVIRACTPAHDGFQVPPDAAALGRFAPADLVRLGLSARKASTIVRVCQSLDLERLRGLQTEAVEARLERERGLGPWSIGVIFLEGLGRFDRGLVGDLGLLKLCSAIRGRWVESDETAELLEPYGEWKGIASVYLLAAWGRGLLPAVASPDEVRAARVRTRSAAYSP